MTAIATIPARPSTYTNKRWGSALTESQIRAIPVPPSTSSYSAVPQMDLVNKWAVQLEKEGFRLSEPVHFSNGSQFVTKFSLAGEGLPVRDDLGFEAAIMNSYDKSRAISTGVGTRVAVCTNGMMSAELALKTRHTGFVYKRLDHFVQMSAKTVRLRAAATIDMFEEYEHVSVDRSRSDYMIMESMRRNIIPATGIGEVWRHWHTPEHHEFKPRTVWSLYNAFTSYYRGRSEFAATARFGALHRLVKEAFELERKTPEQIVAEFQSSANP